MAENDKKDDILEKKLQFIQKVYENREILFGAYSDKIIRSVKIEKWKELAELAKTLCLMRAHKNHTYCRDTLWQNMKKAALAKVENPKKTSVNMTEGDQLVLKIISEELPSSADNEMSSALNFVTTKYLNESTTNQSLLFSPNNDLSSTSHIPAGPGKRKRTATEDGISKIAEKEQHLLIEHLKLQNYKTKLEILKLETELNLPRSQYTKSFVCDEGDK
ncbi:uncharacterized protein LOC101461666 [Ceratitis capitata]|uniref:Regulatory protein zeste n=1 Tax=Ceratitis capitata TaxID=7213 RepID=W8BXD9_CERCA|nr:uncharacterized protein LOC101461666 [Ceratitis capitata]